MVSPGKQKADADGVVGEDGGWTPVVESLDAALKPLGYIKQPELGYHNQEITMLSPYCHRSNGDLELLDPELHSPELLRCMWEDAITDITLVRTGKGERCPEGFELIDRTPMNYNANLNHGSISWGLKRAVHLAIRRQHVSKRNDYIAEIQVVCGRSDIRPEGQGWELVGTTFAGNQRADCQTVGDEPILAVRRVIRNLVDCPAAVCSVCVLLRNKEEHPPPGYRVIPKDLNRGKFGDVVQLAYQLGGALSTCRLPFRSMILDRYPDQDSAMFPFPGDQLPMFVYPKGMLLEQRSGRDTPKSSFFSFVFTNVDGRRTYTACLTFYEPMRPSAARRLTRKLFTCREESNRDTDNIAQDQATQGRMRMTLHGSLSGGALSSLSQTSGRHSRSGTGTCSGLGRGDPAVWPRALARGGVGSVTPPIAPTSWTKISAATRATRYASQSPGAQPSTAEIFSGAGAAVAEASNGQQVSPIRAAYAGRSLDGRRLRSDLAAPFRENMSTSSDEHGRNEIGAQATGLILPPTATATTSSAAGNDTGDSSLPDELSDDEYDLMCQNEDRPCIFTPKTICVISRFPIYGVLRRFLRHLYAISLSWSRVPLERYISMFVSSVPMPPPGGCPFHVYLEPLENKDPRRSRLKPLSLQRPPNAWLPLMDIDFTAPFRCLSVKSVLTVFALMLQEAKILFLSSRAELLTQVMEALRSLLFPMEWQSVYVPQLPYALAGYLECPGGFMIGMRLTKDEGELERGIGGTAAIVRDLGLDGVANAVNLDAGEVLLYSGHLVDTIVMPASSDCEVTNVAQGIGQAHAYFQASHGRQAAAGDKQRTGRSDRDSCTRTSTRSKYLRKVFGLMFVSGKRRRKLNLNRDNNVNRGGGVDGDEGAEEEGLNSFTSRDEETATPWLPEQLHRRLALRLNRELFGKGGVCVGVEEDLDQYESAFEFAPAPDRTDTFSSEGYGLKHRVHFSNERINPLLDTLGPAREPDLPRVGSDRHSTASGSGSPVYLEVDTSTLVRDCFLVCMAELLGGICGSIHRSDEHSRQSLRMKPLDGLFNMSEFLEGMDESARPFLQRLASTQMFWVMIQKWVSTTDKQLLFFEECAMVVKNRQAGAVVPCRDGCMSDDTQGARCGTQENFIPLVDEVRFKRPDLCGLDLCGSVQFDGARSTPLATPQFHRLRKHGEGMMTPEMKGTTVELTSRVESTSNPPWFRRCGQENANSGEADAETRPSGDTRDTPSQPRQIGQVSQRVSIGAGSEKSLDALPGAASPIIIPGPTFQDLPEDGRRPSYRYDKGWPTPLDRNLLHTPPDALPQVVLELQNDARFRSNKPLENACHGAIFDASQSEMKPVVSNIPSENAHLQASDLSTLPGDGDRPKPGYRGEKRLWWPHGKGRMIYWDAKVYHGEWRQGHPHGEGSMEYATGNLYTGQWKLGKKSGFGTMTYPDGSRYEGSWMNDERHGQGKYLYASGAVYEGGWERGRMHGTGRYTSASSSRFEGMFRHGRRCGQGRMAYSGGQTYAGEWSDGVRDGFGTYTLPSGTIYEGYFRRDLRHGEGTLRCGNGLITRQLWEDGKLVSDYERIGTKFYSSGPARDEVAKKAKASRRYGHWNISQ